MTDRAVISPRKHARTQMYTWRVLKKTCTDFNRWEATPTAFVPNVFEMASTFRVLVTLV